MLHIFPDKISRDFRPNSAVSYPVSLNEST